jgi:hypothetical protein
MCPRRGSPGVAELAGVRRSGDCQKTGVTLDGTEGGVHFPRAVRRPRPGADVAVVPPLPGRRARRAESLGRGGTHPPSYGCGYLSPMPAMGPSGEGVPWPRFATHRCHPRPLAPYGVATPRGQPGVHGARRCSPRRSVRAGRRGARRPVTRVQGAMSCSRAYAERNSPSPRVGPSTRCWPSVC